MVSMKADIPAGQQHAEGVVGVGSVGASEPEVYGWFQWVKADQIQEFEAAGWRMRAHVSRFHYDSYLMFKPVDGAQSVPKTDPPPGP